MAWSSCAGFSNGSIWKIENSTGLDAKWRLSALCPPHQQNVRCFNEVETVGTSTYRHQKNLEQKKKWKRKINWFKEEWIFGSSKPSHPLCSWTFEDSSWSCLEWWLHWKSSISRLFKTFCFLPVVQWSVRDVVLIQGRSQNVQHVWKIICREKRMFPTQLRKKSESLGISKENFHLSKLRRPGSWLHYLHFWSWSKTSPPPPPWRFRLVYVQYFQLENIYWTLYVVRSLQSLPSLNDCHELLRGGNHLPLVALC